jgi:hypothetical protein
VVEFLRDSLAGVAILGCLAALVAYMALAIREQP